MIITWLTGGLGNQMFQYAAGLALAHERRTVLKLDVTWYGEHDGHAPHNRYALGCFNISEQFATLEEISRIRGRALTRTERWSLHVARKLHFFQYAHTLQQRGHSLFQVAGTAAAEMLGQPDDTYLAGMWQSEEFFAPVANQLRLHFSFRYPAAPAALELQKRIAERPSVAVHFRRGDYANPAFAGLGMLGRAYYERSIEVVRRAVPDAVFYFFCDEPEAIRDFHPDVPHVHVDEKWPAHDTFRLIGACDHAIIANSTFSWWAAWLNPAAGRIVVAPDPWFVDGSGARVVPAHWTRIDAVWERT